MAWSIDDFEGEKFYSPFGYAPCGVTIIDYGIQWYFGCYRNRALLEVMAELSGCHENCVGDLLVMWVPCFTRGEHFGYIVHRFLHLELVTLGLLFDDENRTDHLIRRRDI